MLDTRDLFSVSIHLNSRLLILFYLIFSVFAAFLLFDTFPARAETEVGGPITTDTTWTLANSPYIVATESVSVTQGTELTIEPGVIVRFNPGLKLWVNGTLDARGTASNPITFTSNQVSPAPGDWGNIDFRGSDVNTIVDNAGNYISGSVLQHCVIEYGGWDGVYFQNAIYVESRSMLVNRCRIEDNLGSGIVILGNPDFPSWVLNNLIANNRSWGYGGGVLLRWGVIKNNTIINNKADGGGDGGGIFASNAEIINNIVTNNTTEHHLNTLGGGIFIDADITGKTVIKGNFIQGNSDVESGGGIYINADHSGAELLIQENLISGNSSHTNGGGIYINGSEGLVTLQGNYITDNIADSNEDSVGSGGGVYCLYSEGTHILQDNVITGNSAGDSGGGIFTNECDIIGNMVANNIAVNFGGGIVSSGDMMNNTISANSLTGASSRGSGIYLTGSGDFLHNSVVNNSGEPNSLTGGIQITDIPEVHHNNIYENFPYNVVVDTLPAYQISGTLNYWDTEDVNIIQESIYDNVDKGSRGEFIFDPFLTEQDFEVPLTPPDMLAVTLIENQVELEWEMDPNFSQGWGYHIYYDVDSFLPPYEGLGLNEGDSPIDVGDQTTIILSGLEPYIDYFIAITVYDDAGKESNFTIYKIDQPEEPFPAIPNGLTATLLGDRVELEWEMDPDFNDGWSYEVSYDTDSYWAPYNGVGLNEGDSPINVGGQTNVVFSGLDPYIEYYFAVRLYNNNGTPGGYAIAIVEQPPPPPIIYLPLVWR